MSRAPGRLARPGISITEPVAGYYKRKLVSGGVYVPTRIWYGPPADPETGEPLDRSWRWQAMCGDTLYAGDVAIQQVWTACCNNPISEAEWRFMIAEREWCREFAPHEPQANPTRAIDLNALPPLF